jgi:hypothetical protein
MARHQDGRHGQDFCMSAVTNNEQIAGDGQIKP